MGLDLIVERTQQLLQLKLEARHLQLEILLSEALPMLTADPDQLEQVLVNLLLNACDASPARWIAFSARPAPNDMVLIEIVDHGFGIAPADLENVFDPFFTTKPRGEGTGLGLSITEGSFVTTPGASSFEARPKKGPP